MIGILTEPQTRFAVATISVCVRSEEHTSELQSQSNLVCRLLLEKKKKKKTSEAFARIRKRPVAMKFEHNGAARSCQFDKRRSINDVPHDEVHISALA